MTSENTAAGFTNNIIENTSIKPQQVILVSLCVFLNMIDGFDITAMAITVGLIGEELNLYESTLGLLFSSALAGMMIGAMGIASISDIVGRRKVIIFSVMLMSISVTLTGFASDLTHLIILRFISGIAGGALLASQAALVAEYSSTRFKALSVCLVTAGYPLGAMLTGVLAGYILPDFGWRGLFIFGGSLTLVLAVLAIILIPESIDFILQKNGENALIDINKILKKLGHETLCKLPKLEPSVNNNIVSNVKTLFSKNYRVNTIYLWFIFLLCFTSLYFLMSWLPRLVVISGLDENIGRMAFSIFNLGGVIGILLLGVFSIQKHLSELVGYFILLSAFIMSSYILLPVKEGFVMISCFFIGLFLQGGFVGLYAIASKFYPSNVKATGIGWAIGLGRFGAVIGPAIAGFMIASGLSMGVNMIIFALPLLLSVFFIFALKVR